MICGPSDCKNVAYSFHFPVWVAIILSVVASTIYNPFLSFELWILFYQKYSKFTKEKKKVCTT